MDMTRRILEGIHEVELDITPEFRKPEFDPQYITQALLHNGWQEKGPPKFVSSSVELSTWEHPDIDGATIEVVIDTEKDVLAKDSITFKKGKEFESVYSAKPATVKKLTDAWKTGAVGRGAAPVGQGKYPEILESSAVAGLIGNRPWAKHGGFVISKENPVVVKTPPGVLGTMGSVKIFLDASGLTYEYTWDEPLFRVFGSPGMTKDQVNKAFTKLLTELDVVLGEPHP